MLNRPIKEPKIKVVGIAKDEAPYLAEWIHHHIYFGFDSVSVYTNRTTDNSTIILEEISKKHKNINFSSIDWIDLCPRQISSGLQTIAYSYAIGQARAENDCSHILFLDIDEFWIPKDFRSSIKDCLQQLPQFDSLSFEWLNQAAEDGEFQKIPQELSLTLGGGNIKSITRIDSQIKKIRPHLPKFEDGAIQLLANNKNIPPTTKESQVLPATLNSFKDFAILHRMFRSEHEYLASLFRGNPEDTEKKLKTNRGNGYVRASPSHYTHKINEKEYTSYTESLEKFTKPLSAEIEKAKSFVQTRSKQAISLIFDTGLAHPKELEKTISGLKNPEVKLEVDKINEFKSNLHPKATAALESNNPDELRDKAIEFEINGNLHSAYLLMRKASNLRPNGPLIKEKIKQYKSKLKI